MTKHFGFPTQIRHEYGALVLLSPYNANLVNSVKTLPMADRKWDANRKVWLVDPKHIDQLISWVDAYTGEKVPSPLPLTGVASGGKVTQVLTLKYLGGCKVREDGSKSAFGLVDGEWKVIFSEAVLQLWFEGIEPDESSVSVKTRVGTYYSILGVKKTATADELKTAFRRMALQWHPDHCKEVDAAEMFIKVKQAFDLLSDSGKRARYDMGLELQTEFDRKERASQLRERRNTLVVQSAYRAPLRCGILLVEGLLKLGRIEVTKIHGWQDIVDAEGKTLISSWPKGATELVEEWI
jgi:hypothetical protein